MPKKKNQHTSHPKDPTAAERKNDHIALAFKSQVMASQLDPRFYYEPLFAAHPSIADFAPIAFAQRTLRVPIWVSSMTGGTKAARNINQNLARACKEFGMGMGLGSCRQLLYSDEFLADFDVRSWMPDQPLFANLGVAQVEQLLLKKECWRIEKLLEQLRADGLIVHVNPMQEAMQPEGDVFTRPAIETIETLLGELSIPLIIKEVGQGFGPKSIMRLLRLPLMAIEFAAAGGTNFSQLELLRSDALRQEVFEKIAYVGHTAVEMLAWANDAAARLASDCQTQFLIISGGVNNFLDGYYLLKKSRLPAVYGQASGFLRHAQGDYAELQTFVAAQVQGLALASAYLQVKN